MKLISKLKYQKKRKNDIKNISKENNNELQSTFGFVIKIPNEYMNEHLMKGSAQHKRKGNTEKNENIKYFS